MFGIGESDRSALKLLKTDHEKVTELFDAYESAKRDGNSSRKEKLAKEICRELTVHAQIEEEIFYPAIAKASDDLQDLVGEAAVEHQSLKDIIGRLQSAPASDPLYDAGVKVLSEYVKHHVKEEEAEIFPKVRSTEIDLEALGDQMSARKSRLESSSGPKARPVINATAPAGD